MKNEKIQIVYRRVDELREYENNPRKNDKAVKAVAASIELAGFKVPMVIDTDGVIVAGHTRLKAAKKLGMTEVPCIIADDLSEDQIRAFRLADNKVSELAEWDFEKLEEEMAVLEKTGIDMSVFGFDVAEEGDGTDGDEMYSTKVSVPHYEPSMEEAPSLFDLADTDKYDELCKAIEASGVTKLEKKFLKLAAARHIVFNYKFIAEYYAHAEPEMQKLMEDSALVIIDVENAIANGYAKLKEEFEELLEDDEDDAYDA